MIQDISSVWMQPPITKLPSGFTKHEAETPGPDPGLAQLMTALCVAARVTDLCAHPTTLGLAGLVTTGS